MKNMTWLIFESNPWLLPAIAFVVLAVATELPYWVTRSLHKKPPENHDALNAVLAGILTLSSFVLGLSFSQASGRFDARRGLVISEANAIGTTWLRANQLEPAQMQQFRHVLTDYAAMKLKVYQTPGARDLQQQAIEQTGRDQATLWEIASSALRAHPANLGLSLLMQSLNDTIDVGAAIRQALTSHVPTAVVTLTLVLIALGALSLGLRFALDESRPRVVSIIYVVASVVVFSMMVDYDRPGTGLVTVSVTPLQLQVRSMQSAPK
ncbi:MAG TPA: hypothetical protein VF741_06780 [Candidatus Aquilonibacter sp.]